MTVPLLLPKIELNKTRTFFFFKEHLILCNVSSYSSVRQHCHAVKPGKQFGTELLLQRQGVKNKSLCIYRTKTLLTTHTSPIKPNLQSNTLPCTACCSYSAQQEGGERGLQLSDIMEMLVEDSRIPPPRWRWVSMKMRQLLSFQNCFFLLCHRGASQGQCLSLLLSAEEQKAYKLYRSNSYHLKFFLILIFA